MHDHRACSSAFLAKKAGAALKETMGTVGAAAVAKRPSIPISTSVKNPVGAPDSSLRRYGHPDVPVGPAALVIVAAVWRTPIVHLR